MRTIFWLVLLTGLLFPIFADEKKPYFRKGIDSILSYPYPNSAPDTYEKAIRIPVPDPYEAFRIEFLNSEEIQGKKEYVRIESNKFHNTGSYWRWQKGKTQVIWYEKSHIILKFQQHRIVQWFEPGIAGEFKMQWTFPDNSQLLIYKYPDSRTNKYIFYNREGKLLQYYRLVPDGGFLSQKVKWGNLEFHFNPIYRFYVKQFTSSDLYPSLVRFLKQRTGGQNQGKIPILLFDQLRDYRDYRQNQKATSGSIGKREEVMLCCNDHRLADFSDPLAADPPDEITFHKLIHGLTENILSQGCFQTRPNQDDFTIRKTGGFLSPGLAEAFLAQHNELYHRFLQRQFFTYFDKKLISVDSFPKPTTQLYPISAMMFLEYLHNHKMEPGISQLYQKSCSRSFLHSNTPGLTNLYQLAMKHFQKNRSSYRNGYQNLNLNNISYYYKHRDNLPGFKKLAQDFQPKNIITQVKRIPYFFHAYKNQTPYYRQAVRDTFVSVTSGTKSIQKDADFYTAHNGKYLVHHDISQRDGSLFKVSLEFDGHTLINERNGTLKWIFPDGSRAISHRQRPQKIFYHNRIGQRLLTDNSNLYEHFTLTGKEEMILTTNQPIEIQYKNLNPSYKSIILIVDKNLPDSVFRNPVEIAYQAEGKVKFTGLPVGEYEARLFLNWPFGGVRVYQRLPITIQEKAAKKQLETKK